MGTSLPMGRLPFVLELPALLLPALLSPHHPFLCQSWECDGRPGVGSSHRDVPAKRFPQRRAS
eukprot:365349-Chlamydomonas_euryale.AAC.13